MIGFFGAIIRATPPQRTNMKYKLVAFLFALSQVGPAFSAQKWIVEKDPLNVCVRPTHLESDEWAVMQPT